MCGGLGLALRWLHLTPACPLGLELHESLVVHVTNSRVLSIQPIHSSYHWACSVIAVIAIYGISATRSSGLTSWDMLAWLAGDRASVSLLKFSDALQVLNSVG